MQEISVFLLHSGWDETDMGGPNAPITIDKSIEGMVLVIDSTDIKCTGKFQNCDGKELLGKARAIWIFL